MQKNKYNINRECINYLADMFEGNMTSASQALIKIDLMKNENTDVNLDFLIKLYLKIQITLQIILLIMQWRVTLKGSIAVFIS